VIARQLGESGRLRDVLLAESTLPMRSAQLAYLLDVMFGDERYHLDHDPPLCLREIIDADRGLYDPPANDPDHLIYRTAEDHRFKTFVRGDGAQLSDAGKRRKAIRRKKKLDPNRVRRQWPSRKFPTRAGFT
jgi:hypothetical protein